MILFESSALRNSINLSGRSIAVGYCFSRKAILALKVVIAFSLSTDLSANSYLLDHQNSTKFFGPQGAGIATVLQ